MGSERLQRAAKAVTTSTHPPEKIQALADALLLLSEEAQRLEQSYANLRQLYQEVRQELAASHEHLHAKIYELNATSCYLENILKNISQGILFLDLKGTITTYNAAAQTLLGIFERKALFHPFWDHFRDDLFGFSMKQLLKEKKSPTSTLYHELKTPKGSRDLEIEAKFLLPCRTRRQTNLCPPSFHGLLLVLRDVTEMRHLQMLAERHDRMEEIGSMAAIVAHEIRNPLGGIKGFAALLERDLIDKPEQRKMAQAIVEGARQLNQLLSHILHYAHPPEIHLESTDLLHLVRETEQLLKADNGLDANITIKAPECPLMAAVDTMQIKAALYNIIINAVEATLPGKKTNPITILLKKGKGEIELSVRDRGHGIPPEHLEKIFSPFFTTKPEGNGLGLAEAQKIVRAHGGKIEVTSTVGKGSIFTMKLPTPLEKRKQRQHAH